MTDLFDDSEFEAEMAPYEEALRRLLAEAGYPGAHVYTEWSGIFTEHVPADVVERAWTVLNASPPR
jgi:hypothetical protein